MRALPSIAGEFTTRGVPLSERLEFVKWLGVALMLVDHAAKFAGWETPAWQLLGRGAYPLFALAFGYALNVCPDVRALLVRLLYCGLLAEVLGAWTVTGGSPFNVLISFALCAYLIHKRRAGSGPVRLAIAGVFVWLVAEFTEYGVAGVLTTLAACWFWGAPSWARAGLLLAASVLLIVPNGVWWATPWLVVGIGFCFAPVGVPRVPRVFYWLYVGQWPVWWVLR